MARQTTESSFDELTRGLASGGVSRREALKWLGATLLGGALAFTPKVAEAAPATWCYLINFEGQTSVVCPNFPDETNKKSRARCEQLRASDPKATSSKFKRQNALLK
jgi:hypothetical protein